MSSFPPPLRQVRAAHDESTLVVYQAYTPGIADAAVRDQTFSTGFKTERMTWIKPSFRWMLYRSGCGTKPGQERVLAITLTRAGFDDALGMACLSHYEPDVHASHDEWKAQLAASPVRIQWDPERGPALEALPWRAIQVGLSGPAVASYLSSWIVGIEDVTPAAHAADVAITSGGAVPEARDERPYPVPAPVLARLGMQPDG